MGELKSCPFCGGSPIWGIGCHVDNTPYAYRVECQKCKHVTPFYQTREEAIEAWNRRDERTAKAETNTDDQQVYASVEQTFGIFTTTAPNAVRNWIGVTMSDLIKREDVDKAIRSICDLCGEDKRNNGVMCGACNLDSFIRELDDIPSTEPERKKGRWIYDTERVMNNGGIYSQYHCSECGFQSVSRMDFCGTAAQTCEVSDDILR